MSESKESLTVAFAKAVVTSMEHQLSNWTKFPPEWVAKTALDYAEALADETIRRLSK